MNKYIKDYLWYENSHVLANLNVRATKQREIYKYPQENSPINSVLCENC